MKVLEKIYPKPASEEESSSREQRQQWAGVCFCFDLSSPKQQRTWPFFSAKPSYTHTRSCYLCEVQRLATRSPPPAPDHCWPPHRPGSPRDRADAEHDPAVAGHRRPHPAQGRQGLQEGIQPQQGSTALTSCITAAGWSLVLRLVMRSSFFDSDIFWAACR